MTIRFAGAALAAMLVAGLGGCAAVRDATATRLDPALPWRTVATEPDRERLRNWRRVWDEALPAARQADGGAIAADAALFDPDRALATALPPVGRYRCTTTKLGIHGTATSAYRVEGPSTCTVTSDGPAFRLVREDGAQRFAGSLYGDTDTRAIFLGTLVLGDETNALRYGTDAHRDMIGYLERIGAHRWRLVLPRPQFESILDIVELVPAG